MKALRYIILLLIFTGFVGISSAQTEPGEFNLTDFAVAPQICGGCHVSNFEEWEGSMHAASNSDPFYQLTFSMASKATDGEVDTFCPRCHSPISYVTGTDSKIAMNRDIGNASENGVLCDFCHTVKSKTGLGNGQYILSPGNIKFGPWDDADSPFHGTQKSELHTKSDFCSICHYQTHFNNEVVIQSTFQEWLESPYFEDDTTCQDCHMTPGTGFTKNPGNSTSIGKEREHIWTHNTAGGNIFQTRIQSPKHKVLASGMLKAAAKLDVNSKMENNERILLDATISNVGAGHSIPTGSNALRQIWLEVKAIDKDGKVIYSSGELDNAGNIDPAATVYGSVYHDGSGQITMNEWEAASIFSDNRIKAGESVVQNYEINIPSDINGPVIVSTRLLYRTAPQNLIDELFKNAAENVPVVEMAKQEETFGGTEGTPGFGVVYSVMAIIIIILMLRNRD